MIKFTNRVDVSLLGRFNILWLKKRKNAKGINVNVGPEMFMGHIQTMDYTYYYHYARALANS